MQEKFDNATTYIKIICAWLTAFMAQYLGGWDMWLKGLITFVVLDYVTGILKAIYQKKLSSDISFRGGIKKIGIFIIVAVSVCIDNLLHTEIILRTLAIGYYIGHEGISIAENWAAMDLPIPQKLKDILEQLKDNSDKGKKG